MKPVFTLLLLLTAYWIQAHTLIKGQILDEKTKLPLAGATILSQDGRFGVVSDEGGHFTLAVDTIVPAIVVSYLGYATQEIDIESPAAFLKIYLQPSGIDLSQIEIRAANNPLEHLAKVDTRLRPVQSSQELLPLVPGLVIAQHAGGGKAEQIFLRGFDIDHGTDIAIQVDGMPVNMVSHAHGQGYADLHFVIPELVESIDFGKGPYAVDQGNFATSGYVGFRTKDVLDESRIQLEAGQFNTARLLAMVNLLGDNQAAAGQHAYVASEYQLTDGPFESPQAFYRLNTVGKYTGFLAGDRIISVQLSDFRSQWDASGQIPQRAVDQGLIGRFGAIDDTEGGQTSRSNLNIRLAMPSGQQSWLEQQLYISRYQFELYSNFTFFLNDPENGDQIRQKEDRRLFGYNGAWHKRHVLGDLPATARLGWGFRQDLINDIELSHTLNRKTTLDARALGNIDELNAWVYGEYGFALNKWELKAGMRLDHFRFDYEDRLAEQYLPLRSNRNRLSPKLNLTYSPSNRWQLYWQAGGGFHSNDTRSLKSDLSPQLLPSALGSDLGFHWKPAERLLFQGAAWVLWLEDELVYVGDEAVVESSGRTRRLGLDGALRYQIGKYFFADANVSWAQPRALGGENGPEAIPLAPRVTSAGGLTWKGAGGWSGSLRYRHVDSRPANEDGSVTALGYTLLDAAVQYRLPRLEFGLSISNLLNAEWNEAQFDTESRLRAELAPVSELHYTPGSPLFVKARVGFAF